MTSDPDSTPRTLRTNPIPRRAAAAWVLQTVVIASQRRSDAGSLTSARSGPDVTVGDVLIARCPPGGSDVRGCACSRRSRVTLASGCWDRSTGAADRGHRQSVVTSTTKIAGAGVLGNQRRPDESCAAEPAPARPGARRPRRCGTPRGETPRARPIRSASWCSSGDQLDALCALGLQSRIVAAALPDGSTSQPSYLGTVIHDVPARGHAAATRISPRSRAANPDLILGSAALTPEAYPQLSAIAPTVFTGAPGRRVAGQPAHRRRGDGPGRRRRTS